MAPAALRLLPWFLAWVALVPTLLVAPPAAWGADGGGQPEVGIRLLEAPTARANDPRARSYIIDRVAPGTSITRRVEVANGASERRTLLLYVAPATIEDGEFTIAAAGEQSELVQWASVRPEEVSLGPGGRASVTVELRVPPDAAAGEYYGAVVVERPPPEDADVGVALRAGIRIYLSVGPGGEPRSDFRIDSLQAVREPDGTPAVLARVLNAGGRALDLRGDLLLTDGPGGLSGGPFSAQIPTTLAPGQTAPVRIPLEKVISGGPWTATLTLRSGLLERRATAQITFPDEEGEQAVPVEAENLPLRENPNVLIPIAGSLILLAALLLLLALLRRRTKAKEEEPEGAPV